MDHQTRVTKSKRESKRRQNWYRSYADDKKPFLHNYAVVIIRIGDSNNDFEWLNDEKTAFSITLKDANNSDWEEALNIISNFVKDKLMQCGLSVQEVKFRKMQFCTCLIYKQSACAYH